MRKQLFFLILLLSVVFGVSGQITSLFIADDSDNTDNSVKIYQLIQANLPRFHFG